MLMPSLPKTYQQFLATLVLGLTRDSKCDSQKSADHVLITVRMIPVITAIVNTLTSFQNNNTENDAILDDGSYFEEGDIYLPINESSDSNNLVDSSYNLSFIEEDDNCDHPFSGVTFQCSDLSNKLLPPLHMDNGCSPCLQHGIARKFKTVMECIPLAGGLNYNYFKRCTANSSEYVKSKMSICREFGDSCWSIIEIIRFHGCILKVSVNDCQLGCYQ